jgi:hypothetical protein
MRKKGQAALEYLMTYGWAILIIAIVAAALYATGILNPATWVGTKATGFSTIGVNTWAYDAATGGLDVTYQNNAGQRVILTGIDYDDGTLNVTNTANNTLGAGATMTESANLSVTTVGDTYTVSVTIRYDDAQGSPRLDEGTLSGKAT